MNIFNIDLTLVSFKNNTTDRAVHITVIVITVVENWLERETTQWVHCE